MLTFLKCACIYAYVLTLQEYDSKKSKLILSEETLGESLGQHVLASACFGETNKARLVL